MHTLVLLSTPAVALAFLLHFLWQAIVDGRAAKAVFDKSTDEYRFEADMHRHSMMWAGFFIILLVVALLTSIAGGLPRIQSDLKPVHQGFAYSATALGLATGLYFNGWRFPTYHRYFAYGALALLTVALLLGLYFYGILLFGI